MVVHDASLLAYFYVALLSFILAIRLWITNIAHKGSYLPDIVRYSIERDTNTYFIQAGILPRPYLAPSTYLSIKQQWLCNECEPLVPSRFCCGKSIPSKWASDGSIGLREQ